MMLFNCDYCGHNSEAADILKMGAYAQCPECKCTSIPRPVKDDPINSPPDDINRPIHYIFGPYEVRTVLLEWIKCAGIPADEAADFFSMMQYLLRYPKKGKPARDLDKAMRYLKWIRERYE